MTKTVKLNKPAPNFSLPDFSGQEVSLSNFQGQKNIVLIFNRGFTWPFCRMHMAQLRHDYAEFVERNTEVVVVGPEGPREFRKYWAEHNLPFIGLPDPKHTVLRLYGQEVNLFKLGRMPAQVIIDMQGSVRFTHFGKSMQDIPSNQELFDLLDELDLQAEPEISSK